MNFPYSPIDIINMVYYVMSLLFPYPIRTRTHLLDTAPPATYIISLKKQCLHLIICSKYIKNV